MHVVNCLLCIKFIEMKLLLTFKMWSAFSRPILYTIVFVFVFVFGRIAVPIIRIQLIGDIHLFGTALEFKPVSSPVYRLWNFGSASPRCEERSRATFIGYVLCRKTGCNQPISKPKFLRHPVSFSLSQVDVLSYVTMKPPRP